MVSTNRADLGWHVEILGSCLRWFCLVGFLVWHEATIWILESGARIGRRILLSLRPPLRRQDKGTVGLVPVGSRALAVSGVQVAAWSAGGEARCLVGGSR